MHSTKHEGRIAELASQIVQRETRIAEIEAKIAERDHRIIEQDKQIVRQQLNIAKLTQKTKAMENQINALHQEISYGNDRIKELQDIIHEILTSTTWKISAPLRLLGLIKRKIISGGLLIYRILYRHSIWTLISKGLRIWYKEGYRGISFRIRQYRPSMQTTTHSTDLFSQATLKNFTPAVINHNAHGEYSLASQSDGYVYIEPHMPDRLAWIIADMKSAPSFSIVVPVYNTPPDLLQAAIDSVMSQWYPHWQLVLADDASSEEATCRLLSDIEHPQIKVLRLKENHGISGATNAAIRASDGEFVVFLDHDDELTVDCLYELALCINRDTPDFIYSDEDKIKVNGEYTEPHFKPDWSPDTIMSTMYTCHVSCVRRSLIERVGYLRPEYDGCQDWDLVLRLAEQTQKISHIAKVLYHWRIIPGSIALDIGAKESVLEASRRARADAITRRGLNGSIEPLDSMPGYHRINYHPNGSPLISIIIPTRDNARLLRRCVESIVSLSSYRNFEIVLLDNGSHDPDALSFYDRLKDEGVIKLLRHEAPFNYSALNNLGAGQAGGELLLFLNDDTEVQSPDWLERLAGYAQLPHIGSVGAKLLYPGGKLVQHAGILNLEDGPGHAFLKQDGESPGYFMRNLLEYNWLAVTGACLMIESKKFQVLGGFDESLPIAYNDIELCMRCIEKGFYNVVCQAVTLIHHESASRGSDDIDADRRKRLQMELRRLYGAHPDYFQYDPFHNINLHPNGINFEVPA